MRTRITVVACIALVSVLGIIGCQSQQVAPTAAPAATAQAQSPQQTIKVGIEAIVSGPMAPTGIAQERFYRMAIDDINAKGGVKVGNQTYRFEGVTADDHFTADGGREAANQLVLSEKVKFAVGGAGAPAAGAQPAFEAAKVLQFAVNALNPNLGPSHPYTFMAGMAHSSARMSAMYSWLAKAHPEAKRVVILAIDNASARQDIQYAEESAKANGISIVGSEFLPQDIKELDTIALRVIRQNPDAIDFNAVAAAPAIFLPLAKSLSAQGFRGTLFTTGVANSQSLVAAGPAAEGLVFANLMQWDVPAVAEAEKQVIRKYISAYGEAELQMSMEGSYVVPALIAQAMEKSGTVDDTTKIANVLRDGEWDTMWGKMRFTGEKTVGARAVLETRIYLSKVENGKFITFDSIKASLP